MNGRGHRSARHDRSSLRATLGLMALAPLLACGISQESRPYVSPPTGGSSGSGFDAGTSTGPAPVIELRAPVANALLAGTSSPEIRARITVAMGLLQPSSIGFALTKDDAPTGTAAAATRLLSGPFTDAQFTGRMDLQGLEGGSYTLTVSAATTKGMSTTATAAVIVDAGPKISIVDPAADSHHKGSLIVSVIVDSAPFEPTLSPLEATVAGKAVDLQMTGTPNTYQGSVDFRSYEPPLSGQQLLTVAAKNARGTRTVATASFVVDESGPVIDMTTPMPADVVGRVIEVRAHITDDAGVLDSSVIALVGDQTTPQFKLNLLPHGGGIYSAPFDTAQLTRCGLRAGGVATPGTFCNVYPTVSFRASDALGNESTVAYEFGIDNQPPLLDLDPPEIRISRRKDTVQCSWTFDPLGDHALRRGNMPDDNCAVSQVFQLRARAQDDSNYGTFLEVAPLAGIDPARIDVFLLNDTSQPLTVDSDGDGICDEINPKLVPTTSPPTSSREVLKIRLGAVPPQGAANFMPDPSLMGETRCEEGDGPLLPPLLCRYEEPTIAISYGPHAPAIWSLEPIEPMGLRCFGNQFDAFANHIGGSKSRGQGSAAPGWACIAVQATDLVGNTGVSAPLRVWIDYDGDQACPAQDHGATTPPPDCTGRFNKQFATVDKTACTSRRYDRTLPIEICADGNCSR